MYSVHIHEIHNPEEWSNTLADFRSSVYITDLWLQGVKRPKATPVYFYFKSDDEIVAKIAGLALKNRKNRPDILHFYSGIAFRSAKIELIRKCYRKLVVLAKKQKFDKLVIESNDYSEEFCIEIPDLVITRRRTEYHLNLNSEKDLFYSKLNDTIRNHIRRAEKKGSKVVTSTSPEILRKLVDYLEITRKIRVSKGYPFYTYFPLNNLDENALKLYLRNGLATMFYVITNDEINCILYVLLHGKRSFFLLIGTTEKGYDLHSPVFVYYNTMSILKKQGFEICNLGGVSANPAAQKGLIYHKKSLGAHEVKLMNYKTYFLSFPLKLLNPLMMVYDLLPNNEFTMSIRKAVRKLLN